MSSRTPSAPADPPAAPCTAPAVSCVLFLDWSSMGVQHLKQEITGVTSEGNRMDHT